MKEYQGSGLPDYIGVGLRVLFVGINPGLISAQVGHHFAGPTNRFWKLLSTSTLVPGPLTYRDDARLLEWGLGLTNVVTRPTPGVKELTRQEYQSGLGTLLGKISCYRPALIALLGLSIGQILCAGSPDLTFSNASTSKKIKPGPQPWKIQGIPVFVLPNPSGRNAHYSYEKMQGWFYELEQAVVRMEQR